VQVAIASPNDVPKSPPQLWREPGRKSLSVSGGLKMSSFFMPVLALCKPACKSWKGRYHGIKENIIP